MRGTTAQAQPHTPAFQPTKYSVPHTARDGVGQLPDGEGGGLPPLHEVHATPPLQGRELAQGGSTTDTTDVFPFLSPHAGLTPHLVTSAPHTTVHNLAITQPLPWASTHQRMQPTTIWAHTDGGLAHALAHATPQPAPVEALGAHAVKGLHLHTDTGHTQHWALGRHTNQRSLHTHGSKLTLAVHRTETVLLRTCRVTLCHRS